MSSSSSTLSACPVAVQDLLDGVLGEGFAVVTSAVPSHCGEPCDEQAFEVRHDRATTIARFRARPSTALGQPVMLDATSIASAICGRVVQAMEDIEVPDW